MAKIKIGIGAAIVLWTTAYQLWIAREFPWWEYRFQFPFSLGFGPWGSITAGLLAVGMSTYAKPCAQRRLLYSVVAGCAVQFAVVELMLWLRQPRIVYIVIVLNALIAAQFLRFFDLQMSDWYRAPRKTDANVDKPQSPSSDVIRYVLGFIPLWVVLHFTFGYLRSAAIAGGIMSMGFLLAQIARSRQRRAG